MSIAQGEGRKRVDDRHGQSGKVTFSLGGHNPDVLTCIANLSNDEVFTPPVFAGEMLDTLADAWAEAHDGRSIWSDATVTFLDPFTKSGVFLREITKRLVDGLAEQMPDLQQRVNHILTRQVFGIGITQLTALLARRSVYCSKNATGEHSIATGFDRPWGNIWYERTEHTWVNRKRVRQANPLTGDDEVVEQVGTGRCKYCGASEAEYSRDEVLETHAYAFIHTDDISSRLAEIFGVNVHFDVIIGNPPYQLSDGGFGTSAAPIYDKFIEQAQRLHPRFLTMVVPARWYSGGKGLAAFRSAMLHDRQIVELHDFPDSRDCFPEVDVAGGICYFLWERGADRDCTVVTHTGTHTSSSVRPLLEQGADIFIRQNEALSILRKISAVDGAHRQDGSLTLEPDRRFSALVSARKPFGLASNFRGAMTETAPNDVMVVQNGGTSWANRSEISAGRDLIDRWKVLISYTSSEHAGQADKNGQKRVLSRVEVLPPGTATTETYLIAGSFESRTQADILVQYLKTKFVRFLVSQLVTTQHVTRGSFAFVPIQDFTRPWTDADLYAKYHLTEDEIAFIESMIRPMELDDNA
ncbi:Eco57I restriction-modification methylase domain-containing protein [Pseudoclavibacter caeni]|uniref:site-specific DNA-methyltransferase (adenine-specific) n=2 Tax=Pseudoclavibacter caeni TaxID=908846 RepID=A0A7C8FTV7_9MICO|nr:Eco57I restriction-modification methylase domain-containing protein [Pseudoclavibacter caeni]KAB1633552.1 restriction endonuclease [Pseudoclavibacter caeni]NYJ96444.1 site-specific DNA-methyltransferase (adenine-specific) [Pseudoclavibacter caeni]